MASEQSYVLCSIARAEREASIVRSCCLNRRELTCWSSVRTITEAACALMARAASAAI